MILLVHLLLGAAIGQKISNPYMAIILALLSHYVLDLIPHFDYSLTDTDKRHWIRLWPNIIKISIDLAVGILLIVIFSANRLIIYTCAFFAALPDGLTVINSIFPGQYLELHRRFHIDIIHAKKDQKISNFWRILGEIIVVLISIILLRA